MRLYLGTHRPRWLTMGGPRLMVSLNTLPQHKAHVAVVPWFVDSGGFTELQQHGRWRTTAAQHVERCAAVVERYGNVEWVSPQDWMCEPAVITGGKFKTMTFAGTGLSVEEHQHLTVQNYIELTAMAPDVPWIPVLQGWGVDDYHVCADLYASAGVDLADAPLVGVGSVCRRESMPEAQVIMQTLAERGYALHGFGFKQEGIAQCWPWMASADSMAWSFNARHEKGSCGRPNGRGGVVKSCANCRHYALDWYDRTIAKVQPVQLPLEVWA
jgi:hypothetical protein